MRGFFTQQAPNCGVVTVQVWRQTGEGVYNQWGDIDSSAPEAPIPALAGRRKVKTLENCVFEPRTTGVEARERGVDGLTYSKVTLYLSDPRTDIQPGDMFVFDDHNGKSEAWKLEGEGETNNYVSPFTGIVGGRELFLIRIREAKNG